MSYVIVNDTVKAVSKLKDNGYPWILDVSQEALYVLIEPQHMKGFSRIKSFPTLLYNLWIKSRSDDPVEHRVPWSHNYCGLRSYLKP